MYFLAAFLIKNVLYTCRRLKEGRNQEKTPSFLLLYIIKDFFRICYYCWL